jgi:hypothetical protein
MVTFLTAGNLHEKQAPGKCIAKGLEALTIVPSHIAPTPQMSSPVKRPFYRRPTGFLSSDATGKMSHRVVGPMNLMADQRTRCVNSVS